MLAFAFVSRVIPIRPLVRGATQPLEANRLEEEGEGESLTRDFVGEDWAFFDGREHDLGWWLVNECLWGRVNDELSAG